MVDHQALLAGGGVVDDRVSMLCVLQSETFNSEVVAEEHGTEEYVHLKSRDDEYEFLESTMPRSRQPPPQRPEGEAYRHWCWTLGHV
jgi:hypothetical protein